MYGNSQCYKSGAIKLERQEKLNLYNEAIAFYEFAECGRKNVLENKNVESYIPYIVNMSFATELFLKLLLIENGKTAGEVKKLSHHLSDLYEQLTDEQKNAIYKSFKQPMIYSIPNELKRANDAFVRWRYLVLDKSHRQIKRSHTSHPFCEKSKALSGKQTNDDGSGPNAIPLYFLKELNEALCSMCRDF